MFIELTDHLRCPASHDEQFLVLMPDRVADRDVVRGSLACPVCHRTFPIEDWVARFGAAAPAGAATSALGGDAVLALLGLGSPGGYASLVGAAATAAPELATLLPGVALVLVNAPETVPPVPLASRLVAPRLPLKAGTMRGVVLGAEAASDPAWVAEAVRAVLPGNRVVGEGEAPAHPELELSASIPGCWVGTRVRRR